MRFILFHSVVVIAVSLALTSNLVTHALSLNTLNVSKSKYDREVKLRKKAEKDLEKAEESADKWKEQAIDLLAKVEKSDNERIRQSKVNSNTPKYKYPRPIFVKEVQ